MLSVKLLDYIKDHEVLLWVLCTLGMPVALMAAVSLATCAIVVPVYYVASLF